MYCFALKCFPGKKQDPAEEPLYYYIHASSNIERQEWLADLKAAIRKAMPRSASPPVENQLNMKTVYADLDTDTKVSSEKSNPQRTWTVSVEKT